MVIGQAAGVAAALASKQKIAVQQLPYPVLRERLLAQGQVLALPVAPPTAALPGAGFTPAHSLPGLPAAPAASASTPSMWQRSGETRIVTTP